MRPLSFYLPAVRDRFLKKALIHRQLQINHSGSIFQMKSCWEYPTAYESLLRPLHSKSTIAPLFWTSISSIWNKIILGEVIFYLNGFNLGLYMKGKYHFRVFFHFIFPYSFLTTKIPFTLDEYYTLIVSDIWKLPFSGFWSKTKSDVMKLKILCNHKLELKRLSDMQPSKIHYYFMPSHCLAIKVELIISTEIQVIWWTPFSLSL